MTAYDKAPEQYRDPFDRIVARLNAVVTEALADLEAAERDGRNQAAADIAMHASNDMQRLIDAAGALINGSLSTLGQSDVDGIFDKGTDD